MPGGRPPFEPTEKQRGQVEAMVRYGISEAEISRAIGISEPTLRKHFAEEIDTGATKANAQVGEFLFSTIVGLSIPGREPVTDGRSRVTAAIFWAKTRMKWSEIIKHEHGGDPTGVPIKTENAHSLSIISDALDRIAARLAGDASSDADEDGPGEDPPEA